MSTRRVDETTSTFHLQAAGEYLDAARTSYIDKSYIASASSSCLSGIRSGDAVCAAELGQVSQGEHAGAPLLLGTTSRVQRGQDLLQTFVDAKNLAHYLTISITNEMASQLLAKATELNDLARAAVLRAGYKMP